MRVLAPLLCFFAWGCSADCVATSDVQVTLRPNQAVNVSAITTIRLLLSIDGASPKLLDVTLKKELTHQPTTILLQPDTTPTKVYNLGLTIEALDALGGLLAIGSAAGDMSPKGCNRLDAPLGPLPGMGDGGLPDLALPIIGDLAVPPNADLSLLDDLACAPLPDEDGDERGDQCDLCPADYDPTPTDSDGDGVPDACDPDVDVPGNQVLYYDPFNVDSGHWSGGWTVSGSERVVQTMAQGRLISGNGVDSLPVNVRFQAFVTIPFIEGVGSSFESDVGIFLGNQADSTSTTNGVLCALHHVPNDPGTLDIDIIQNGAITTTMSQPFPFGTGPVYRLRLTQNAGTYTCEGATSGLRPATVSTTTQAPSAPQYMLLHATNVEAHFQSVIVESVNP